MCYCVDEFVVGGVVWIVGIGVVYGCWQLFVVFVVYVAGGV